VLLTGKHTEIQLIEALSGKLFREALDGTLFREALDGKLL
jgi:hypothetical protein